MRRIPGLSNGGRPKAANANKAGKARPEQARVRKSVPPTPAAAPSLAPMPSATHKATPPVLEMRFAYLAIAAHFPGIAREQIVAAHRLFPGHMRADIQPVVERLFGQRAERFVGLLEQHRYETMTFASLMRDGQYATMMAPLQYEDVDVGEDRPVRCLENGLWLCRAGAMAYAVLLSRHREFNHETGLWVEVAVPAGEAGAEITRDVFAELERAVAQARTYRGKVLSLEQATHYAGMASGVKVHRLPPVAADEVILPEATRKLLDRNVLSFMNARDGLRALGLQTKKGILLYGPPGTGKTHTIRYLASSLKGTTTLIITAEQVGLLAQYMSLARLLQPAMVVIEDVDLIARSREETSGVCSEVLLNRLLNEMDGLQENADILFVLTTNRPRALEAALAQRPGRIDQAIEVPLPDEGCREKLVRLYSRGLKLGPALVALAAKRTEGVSAAFIKELMRRTAQAAIARGDGAAKTVVDPSETDLSEALDDMLFAGGKLNATLLGGAAASG
jgi:ATPase family associated with various cellular activities (AAA)